ncbi:xanthine dehydrogenase family protein molybdopterin-binding subunit, partial [candidate division KSB1 bacterium]|nr:xanthine dehydrogenase family protein molybdopterin-binding subunit [candidate division KSB1 bacterium]
MKQILTPQFEGTPNRRDFLKTAGAGIYIWVTLGSTSLLQAQRRGREYPEDFNAYLHISEDGSITCYTGKIEMGQGIFTSLAQMFAEELFLPLSKIKMVMGDTALCPYDGGTTGSRSTKFFGPALRAAAAKARQVLLELAAEKLNAPPERLQMNDGVINIKGTDTKISFAELAHGRRIERQIEGDGTLKDQSDYTVCGKPALRTDAVEKVTGRALYTADIRLPDMLYACVLRPPAHGARLLDVDTTQASSVPGVKIVQKENMVAVLHSKPDLAERALAQVSAKFDQVSEKPDNETIFDHLLESAQTERDVVRTGDIEAGLENSVKTVSATFYNHYVAHAPNEPHAVMVDAGSDPVRVWASTQTPFRVKSDVAGYLGLPEEKIHVMPPFLGGGFGGKKSGPEIRDAARLSQLTGRPVMVMLSRKEEFFYDIFRPAAVLKTRAGLDNDGRLTAWDFENYYAGTRSSEPIYDIPNQRVVYKGSDRGTSAHPFQTGAWRGPGSNSNVFAMESLTDICAEAAGMDPLSFRFKNLSDERMVRVLKAAAERFGHCFEKLPSGKGFGIACTNYLNTYVATIAQVEVDKKTGTVRVYRIVCAQDMGEIINPQGARLQIESCITMGISSALTEEIFFKGGEILTENYDHYELTRFSTVPQIEPVLVKNPDLAPQGCGEPAITTVAAVLANAIFDATGARLYTLPMTPKRILQ